MMEQKLREEQERRRRKEMEERMSLEETREQVGVMGSKGTGSGLVWGRGSVGLWDL